MSNYIPKLLIIAPYHGLLKIIEEIKETRRDVYIDVELGNLQEGARIARSRVSRNYDAILSRGGTLLEIQKAVTIPSVEIKFSAFDMIRMLKTTAGLLTEIAIIGFPSFTRCAQTVCQLLNREASIITIHNEDEAREAVLGIRKSNIGVLIGDQIVNSIAKENNINCMLFLSGPEAVNDAIDHAIEYIRLTRSNQLEIAKLHTIINNVDEKIVGRDEANSWFYSNFDKYLEPKIYEVLEKKLSGADISDYFEADDYLWVIKSFAGPNFGKLCMARRLAPHSDQGNSKIKILDWLNMPQLYYYKYIGDDKKMMQLTEDVSSYGSSLLPVLLLGERGVGKMHIAYAMHKESAKRKKLFFQIECENLEKEEFQTILDQYKEILFGKEGGTVYFEDIERLPPQTQAIVTDYIDNPLVKKNIRLIFSSSVPIEPLIESKVLQRKLGAIVTELILPVPPLRERPGCIEGIADMMLHEYNMIYGKQVIGFDAKAQKMLVDYHWPENINQLKRVISSAILHCSSYHISAEDLNVPLSNEETMVHSGATGLSGIDYHRSLEQTTFEIVSKILEEEEMNHTKAAELLGISRSTLWRILKKNRG